MSNYGFATVYAKSNPPPILRDQEEIELLREPLDAAFQLALHENVIRACIEFIINSTVVSLEIVDGNGIAQTRPFTTFLLRNYYVPYCRRALFYHLVHGIVCVRILRLGNTNFYYPQVLEYDTVKVFMKTLSNGTRVYRAIPMGGDPRQNGKDDGFIRVWVTSPPTKQGWITSHVNSLVRLTSLWNTTQLNYCVASTNNARPPIVTQARITGAEVETDTRTSMYESGAQPDEIMDAVDTSHKVGKKLQRTADRETEETNESLEVQERDPLSGSSLAFSSFQPTYKRPMIRLPLDREYANTSLSQTPPEFGVYGEHYRRMVHYEFNLSEATFTERQNKDATDARLDRNVHTLALWKTIMANEMELIYDGTFRTTDLELYTLKRAYIEHGFAMREIALEKHNAKLRAANGAALTKRKATTTTAAARSQFVDERDLTQNVLKLFARREMTSVHNNGSRALLDTTQLAPQTTTDDLEEFEATPFDVLPPTERIAIIRALLKEVSDEYSARANFTIQMAGIISPNMLADAFQRGLISAEVYAQQYARSYGYPDSMISVPPVCTLQYERKMAEKQFALQERESKHRLEMDEKRFAHELKREKEMNEQRRLDQQQQQRTGALSASSLSSATPSAASGKSKSKGDDKSVKSKHGDSASRAEEKDDGDTHKPRTRSQTRTEKKS